MWILNAIWIFFIQWNFENDYKNLKKNKESECKFKLSKKKYLKRVSVWEPVKNN
jgi:hypothetical protein